MKICAVICELNPFHNGHAHLIKQARDLGFSHIIAIMSGYFTQRGNASIISKKAKTEIALLNGIDLVIELPCVYSLARAEIFAKSSVYLANALGCVDSLIFGSECGDIETLKFAGETSISEKLNNKIKDNLKSGESFAKLRQNLISDLYGEKIADVFSKPNNNLAIEYIKSLNYFESKIKPVTVLRNNNSRDELNNSEKFASSSHLRNMIFENIKSDNFENISEFMPASAFKVLQDEINSKKAPADLRHLERAILMQLKKMSIKDIVTAPDISEGLEFKIFREIQKTNSLDSLIKNIKSKRYTFSRIKRIILSLAFGITKSNQNALPNCIRILGFNEKGKEILSKIKKESSLPIITKYSDILKLKNDGILKNFEFENLIANFYSLSLPELKNIENEKKFSSVNVE